MGRDPTHDLTYVDERPRPFVELLARVDADPRRAVDLGCGPGNATRLFAWASGTGARPTLEALPDGLRERFATELRGALRSAYPTTRVGGESGVVLPFRRIFVVARRGATDGVTDE